jgi:hypothetical protein
MAAIRFNNTRLTNDNTSLKKSRTATEREKIRWLPLLLLLAVFGVLGWYFDVFQTGPVVVGTGVW